MIGDITTAALFSWLLVFCRLGSGIMVLPGLSESYMSPLARLAIALCLSMIILPVVKPLLPLMPESGMIKIILIAKEIAIGLFLGYIVKMIISSMHIAGMIISYQSGLATANMFDPSQGTQGSIIGIFYSMLALLIVFATDMHHLFIAGLVDSYEIFKPSEMLPLGDFSEFLSKTMSGTFMTAFKIASPQIIVGLLLYLSSGIMGRLMPQMQVFFVIMPVQVLIAFIIMMLSLSASLMWFTEYFEETFGIFINSF